MVVYFMYLYVVPLLAVLLVSSRSKNCCGELAVGLTHPE